ncbi:hypothetical protein BV898_03002 [Hypsibius exemplaris]|uniref:Uncharacterized protein n=1 Tax=Hypsibius exemplaris TaxID=2072580 RepID=A0A1W0X6G1_HYPEX|nr:hypothetical protein BV898_03002 [Hypsibius exemplaris]
MWDRQDSNLADSDSTTWAVLLVVSSIALFFSGQNVPPLTASRFSSFISGGLAQQSTLTDFPSPQKIIWRNLQKPKIIRNEMPEHSDFTDFTDFTGFTQHYLSVTAQGPDRGPFTKLCSCSAWNIACC